MQLQPGNWFAPPDGKRSRLFLTNEKHSFLGISTAGSRAKPISSKGVECNGLGYNSCAGLHLRSEPEGLREHTISVGVDRSLDSGLPLFRVLVVRSLENVI